MKYQQILILDLDPASCSSGNCGQIVRLIQTANPFVGVNIKTTKLIQDVPGSIPALVVPKLSSSDSCLGLIHSIRQKWNRVPLLGVFCSTSEGLTDSIQPLLKLLDDFLSCPIREIELVARIQRLLQTNSNSYEATAIDAIKQQFHLESLVGASETFLGVLKKIPRIAQSDATVLISGETGTGKELFARAVHYTSPRYGKPFVPVNCGALPDHLFENEVFGHTKGAFTDASSSEPGLLALAEGGTLFLDEVDSLSPAAQVKLLRFLQEREFRPLGSSKTVKADVRIVAATNANLDQLLAAKLLREDLYHRLYTLFLSVPPLRDRIDDVSALAMHFLAKYENKRTPAGIRLSPSALHKLMCYSWPGNVRELESVIQRSVILSSSAVLQASDVDLPSTTYPDECDDPCLRQAKTRAIEQFELAYLTKLMTAHRGNVSHAAKAAGKERRAFQRLLQKHCLDRSRFIS